MKKINIVLFGMEELGSTFIKQTLRLEQQLMVLYKLQIEIQIVANSNLLFLKKEKTSNAWETFMKKNQTPYKLADIFEIIEQKELENIVVVNATSSAKFRAYSDLLIEQGFYIVESNEIVLPIKLNFYTELQKRLYENTKTLTMYG